LPFVTPISPISRPVITASVARVTMKLSGSIMVMAVVARTSAGASLLAYVTSWPQFWCFF
jgi:hypothetical protein